jgi:hypothetical protein
MALIKISLITSFMAVVGALGALHFAQVEREQEIARLKKENAQIRLAISERQSTGPLNIDSLVPHSPHTKTEVDTVPLAVRQVSEDETSKFPSRSYLNAGQATPMATLQTMAWACDQGDVATARKFLVIDELGPGKGERGLCGTPARRAGSMGFTGGVCCCRHRERWDKTTLSGI